MNKFTRSITVIGLVALVACESKRIEKSPEELAGAEGTLSETKSYSVKVNSEIGKMKFFIRKVSAVVRSIVLEGLWNLARIPFCFGIRALERQTMSVRLSASLFTAIFQKIISVQF